jgi:hypothetical protein
MEVNMMINIICDVLSRVLLKFTNVPEELTAPIFMVLSSSTLKMEAVDLSEKITFYHTTWCHIRDDSISS